MKWTLFLIFTALGTPASAETLIYRFEATIDNAFGSLSANAVLSGHFAFDASQDGEFVQGINNAKLFELFGLSVSDGSESANLSTVPDQSVIWTVVGDDSPVGIPEDFFTVRAESYPAFSGGGTIGGLEIREMYLIWVDEDASANDGYSLPGNSATFNQYERATFQIIGANGSSTDGIITNVSLVPIPAAALLLCSGIITLIGLANTRKISS